MSAKHSHDYSLQARLYKPLSLAERTFLHPILLVYLAGREWEKRKHAVRCCRCLRELASTVYTAVPM